MKTKEQELPVKRDYKSHMFKLIFDDKRKLLALYNAVSGKHYTDPELLTINTLENAIYMSMKNDMSFLIDSRLSLYEHQSTYNPNMALRFLFYLSDLYSEMSKSWNLYGSKRLSIPTPRFVVFYNGREIRPDYEMLKLSDLYTVKEKDYALELTVDVININKGHNPKLMEACKDLCDYAEYTYRVRKYAESMPIEEAVDKSIKECIQEDILKDFLIKCRTEARVMSIYEYNQEEHMRMEREDAFEDGRKIGQDIGQNAERIRIFELMNKMIADGMADQVSRLATEPAFYEEMLKKYEL